MNPQVRECTLDAPSDTPHLDPLDTFGFLGGGALALVLALATLSIVLGRLLDRIFNSSRRTRD